MYSRTSGAGTTQERRADEWDGNTRPRMIVLLPVSVVSSELGAPVWHRFDVTLVKLRTTMS